MSKLVKILQLLDIFDETRAANLRGEINNLVANKVDIILIDFENVKFIDSAALGILVTINKIVKSANKQVFICSINDQVKILFEMTKMDKLFQVFGSQEEFNCQVIAGQEIVNF